MVLNLYIKHLHRYELTTCRTTFIYQTPLSISIDNMKNHKHANPSNTAKARMNRKSILQRKKDQTQLQMVHQATMDSTLQDIECDGGKL